MPSPILLLGQAAAPGRCAQPWRVPAAAGWHQMKTNGLGDTSASINGSTVLGMLGMCQLQQEEQQHWGQHPTLGSQGVSRVSLGIPDPQLSSAQSPLGAVGKRRSWVGSSPASTALPCPQCSEPLIPAAPAPALPHTCLSQGAFGGAHENPPCWC